MNLNNTEQVSTPGGIAGNLHSNLTEKQVMIRTLVAMMIPAVAAVLAMGTNALYNILVAVITAVICHYIIKVVELKSIHRLSEATYKNPYSPLVAGMIVGLCMGELSPYYITAIVSAMTMIVFKWGQEKYFGRKIVNPAAGAKALILLTITLIWMLPDSLTSGMLFYPEHLDYALFTEEGFLGAMRLAEQVGFYGTENLSITQSLILWKSHGWIGGASGILTLASGVLLAFRIKLKWRISLSYLLGMAVLATGLGMLTGGHIPMRIAFHVFTGSVIFLAFYMATEPQTTPVTHKGQYLFGALLAILTLGLQLLGLFGSSFIALAIINPFAYKFDRVRLKESFGRKIRNYLPEEKDPLPYDTTSPVLVYDPSKCIACSRCILACEEVQGTGVLGYGSRGRSIIATAGLGERGSSGCKGCGECLEYCPTGAITEKFPKIPLRKRDINTVITTCSYCSVGCQLELYPTDNKIAKVRGADSPPNNISLCLKGRFGHTYIDRENRVTHPLRKRQDGSFKPITWKEAINEIAEKFNEYDADQIGGISSAQNTNEDNYIFQKFMRAVIGTNNIDHFSRLFYSASIFSLEKMIGPGVMTNSIQELTDTDCILITEADITESHPVIAYYVIKAVKKKGTKLIIISSKKNKLVNMADIWLRPENNTEADWINGLMKIIIDEDLYEHDFVENCTENFKELKTALKKYTAKKVSKTTSIPVDKLIATAKMFAGAKKASIIYDMTIEQHGKGVINVISLINLSSITGNIGKPASGLYPLKDQNNDQGTYDMGVVPDLLTGFQKVDNKKAREIFENEWGTIINSEKGLDAVEMLEAALSGDIKAMLVLGEGPEFSRPNLGEIKRSFDELEFLVVVTPFLNATAKTADIVLPAATFIEKEGTYTNNERRISRVRKGFNPLEESRAEWEILSALASRMNYAMNYKSSAEIMDEIANLTPIYNNVNYQALDNKGLQWPCDDSNKQGTKYLSRENLIKDRIELIPVEYSLSQKEETKKEGPFKFNVMIGRILFHFKTGFMDPQIEALESFIEDPYIEINSKDAENLELINEEKVKVVTKYGEIKARVYVSKRVNPGSVFIPFQYFPFHFVEEDINFKAEPDYEFQFKLPHLQVSNCRIEKTFS